MGSEGVEAVLAHALDALALLAIEFTDEVRHQQRQILQTIAQRRKFYGVARREGIARGYVERLARLAFVAPAIVETICQGQQPAELSTETLLNRINLPLEWSEQSDALGIR
jgi:hypothetical protein